jgi:hypothetical protein
LRAAYQGRSSGSSIASLALLALVHLPPTLGEYKQMMNWFNRVGIFGIGAVFGIVLCIAILVFTERHTVPQISVTVVNNSDYEIKEIKIENKFGYLIHNDLAKNSQLTLPVSMPGEGAYSIKVKLENDATLEGGVGYVESGYSTIEVVFNDRIETQHVSVY